MKSLVFLLLLAACSAQPLENRVIGGADAIPGQFPYMVSIRTIGTHHCGGTIINQRWILTAAHCLVEYPEWFYDIVAGVTKLSDGGDVYYVSKIIYHADWSIATNLDDIGLLKTDKDIQFGDKVQAIPLGDEEVPVGKKLMLTGWGYTSYPGEVSDQLKYLELTSISRNSCAKEWYPTKVSDSQLCTYNGLGEGTCKSDSGGPLVYNDQVVGIVSFGKKCAVGKPDVFTKVSAYRIWIAVNTHETERKANFH